MRILLTYLLPFLLPAIVFIVWTWLRARYIESHGGEPPRFEQGPWFWLFLTGGILTLATIVATVLLQEGGSPGDIYIAPRVIDGEVVPGEHLR